MKVQKCTIVVLLGNDVTSTWKMQERLISKRFCIDHHSIKLIIEKLKDFTGSENFSWKVITPFKVKNLILLINVKRIGSNDTTPPILVKLAM